MYYTVSRVTGYVPGYCHRTNLTVGGRYVILARVDNAGVYSPIDREFDASNQPLLRQIATACRLQTVYPWGMYH